MHVGIIARARRTPLMIFQMLSLVLDVIAGLLAGTCLLRLAMQAQRIPFNQPLGRFVFAMTDWIVMPLRKVIPPWSRWDLSSLVAAWLIKLLQYVLLWLLAGGHGQLGLLPLVSLVGLLQLLVSSLSALVLVYALMSWMQAGSPLFYTADRLVAPWLEPVRRMVPLIGGVDLAPLVLLLVLQLAGMLLAGLQASWMYA
jgi:YggT family protein